MYTIKEVANLLNLTEHTIRFYTDRGLVPNLQRDTNNHRIFNDEAVNWLKAAKNLKKCGMRIEDIKKYVDLCLIGNDSILERYKMIKEQKEQVLKQLEESKSMAEFIEKKEKHYLTIVNEKVKDNTNPYFWEVKN